MNNELRVNDVVLAGRIKEGPTRTPDGCVHFKLACLDDSARGIHCISFGKTAGNMEQYCHPGDEISLEGELCFRDFPNDADFRRTLVVHARHVSYGRKKNTGV